MNGVDSREERPLQDNDRIMVHEPERKVHHYHSLKRREDRDVL